MMTPMARARCSSFSTIAGQRDRETRRNTKIGILAADGFVDQLPRWTGLIRAIPSEVKDVQCFSARSTTITANESGKTCGRRFAGRGPNFAVATNRRHVAARWRRFQIVGHVISIGSVLMNDRRPLSPVCAPDAGDFARQFPAVLIYHHDASLPGDE
jgi:hypothetical protein